MKSIRSDAISGVKWTTLSSAILVITTPVLLFIKTRFLTPEEFGYIAILAIIIGFLRKFEGTGFTKGVIQKDDIGYKEASTLFVFNAITSIFLAILLFLSSSTISSFFDTPGLMVYVRMMSILVITNGPIKFYRAFFEKYFMFKEIGVTEIVRQAILITVMPVLFMLGLGIWGFIYAQIIANIAIFTLYLFYTIKNKTVEVRLFFSFEELKHYMRFGIFTSSRGVLNYTSKRIDEVAIGFFLGAEILGLYHFGKSFLEQVRQIANKAFAKVLFPLFSKLKNDREKMTDVYKLLTYYLALIFFPIFIGIALTAPTFVPLVFGEQWIDSIIIIQVFSFMFIMKMLAESLSVNLLFAVNKPDAVFYIDLVTTGIYFLSLIVCASLGIIAVIVAYSIFILIKTVALQVYARNILEMSFTSYFKLMKKSVIFTVIMATAVLFFQRALSGKVFDIVLLAGAVSIGVIVYGGLTYVFDKKNLIKFYKIAKSK